MSILKKIMLPWLSALLPMLLLAACSGVPGEGEVEELVREKLLGEGANAYLEIENFARLNGYEKGDNHYVVQVRYELVFLKGLEEIAADLEAQAGESVLDQMSAGLGLLALRIKYGDFRAGARFPVEEDIPLVRTEKGWRIFEEAS